MNLNQNKLVLKIDEILSKFISNEDLQITLIGNRWITLTYFYCGVAISKFINSGQNQKTQFELRKQSLAKLNLALQVHLFLKKKNLFFSIQKKQMMIDWYI